MKIAIDMQPCQTDSRHRGIGRYVLELVRAMATSECKPDITLLVDACEMGRMREARRLIRDNGLDARTLSFHYPVQDASVVIGNAADVSRTAGMLRARVLQSLQPDVVLVTSFFEGYDGGYGADSDLDMDVLAGIPTVVVAYDLIPLLFPERYLPEGSPYTEWYRRKLEKFRQFDMYLAISESTRDDLVRLLDIPPERIRVIDAGYRRNGEVRRRNDEDEDGLKAMGIHSPFVLMVGNGDWRKNNIAALACFARLPKSLRDKHQLVLTQVGDDVRAALEVEFSAIASRTLVLGQVSDEVLSRLYAECTVFFFPSLYEGFGLPVLEAMAHGAAVLSSNAGALREVMFEPEALFDPGDIEAGSMLLQRALTEPAFRESLSLRGIEHAMKFTWERSAELALRSIGEASPSRAGNVCEPADEDVSASLAEDAPLVPSGAWVPSDADVGLLAETLRVLGRGAQPRIENALASVLKGRRRRILIDVSCVAVTNTWTGIQRVVRNYCVGLASLAYRNPDVEVHLISFTEEGLRYADEFGIARLGLDLDPLSGAVQALPDDVLFLLDSTWEWPERFNPLVEAVWQKGGEVVRMVYDLVPILVPETCHPGMPPVFRHWMELACARTDGLICISEAVRQDLEAFMDSMAARNALPYRPWTRAVHLGSDLESGRETEPGAIVSSLLENAGARKLLLAVGTVEPRKDHTTIVEAFDALWEEGLDPVLVIVGKQGWNVESLAERMRTHPYLDTRLFWLDHASDGDLDAIMKRADALIQASVSEGFGLPIVEAGSKGVPLLLSDIPVFREIAGEEAGYFPVGDSVALSQLVRDGIARDGWLHPKSIQTLTWEQSSNKLFSELLTPSTLNVVHA